MNLPNFSSSHWQWLTRALFSALSLIFLSQSVHAMGRRHIVYVGELVMRNSQGPESTYYSCQEVNLAASQLSLQIRRLDQTFAEILALSGQEVTRETSNQLATLTSRLEQEKADIDQLFSPELAQRSISLEYQWSFSERDLSKIVKRSLGHKFGKIQMNDPTFEFREASYAFLSPFTDLTIEPADSSPKPVDAEVLAIKVRRVVSPIEACITRGSLVISGLINGSMKQRSESGSSEPVAVKVMLLGR